MGRGKNAAEYRKDIAARYGLKPNKAKPWQYEGRCPVCHHGGFSLTAGDQGLNPLDQIWWCNCQRCHCDPGIIRKTMLADGIPEGWLGSYKRSSQPKPPDDEAARIRAVLREILADPGIRALSDVKIRILEVIDGDAPADWAGFIEFAERAGVARSKRYEAAARWGRRQPK